MACNSSGRSSANNGGTYMATTFNFAAGKPSLAPGVSP